MFVAGMSVAVAVVAHAVPRSRAKTDRYKTLDTFAQALAYIQSSYVKRVDERRLLYGAIKGMINELDPHSAFFSPRRYRALRQDTDGEFAGVGIGLRHRLGAPVVNTVVSNSPAARAGIRVGDRLLEIDGARTSRSGKRTKRGWSALLRGRVGSRVRLQVIRAGWAKARRFELVRRRIVVPTVERFQLESGIGYLSIKRFQEATAHDVERALRHLAARAGGRLQGLVLDLRSNPGGLLDQSVRVADLFLPKGLIVSVVGRSGTKVERHRAHGAGSWTNFRMVVLVDRGTASAAEIVAGALQDNRRAKIVGIKTYGKGSVQTFIDLKDRSGLKLTTAHYYTPSGRSLSGVGIKPDILFTNSISGEGSARQPRIILRGRSHLAAKLKKRLQEDPQLMHGYQILRASLGSK